MVKEKVESKDLTLLDNLPTLRDYMDDMKKTGIKYRGDSIICVLVDLESRIEKLENKEEE